MSKIFSKNLRKYRELAGFKQAKDFANVLGMRYTTYISYENQDREPKYELLCQIADLLHVTTDELLGHKIKNHERGRRKLNHMEEFADMLGPKLYEEFKINESPYANDYDYRLADEGLQVYDRESGRWLDAGTSLLSHLLTGVCSIGR